MFTRAIVRKPGPNFNQGLTTSLLGNPSYTLIQKQHRNMGTITLCALQCVFQTRAEQKPVGERGQGIMVCQMMELLLGFLDTADIGEYADVMGEIAGIVMNGTDRLPFWKNLAVLASIPDLAPPYTVFEE